MVPMWSLVGGCNAEAFGALRSARFEIVFHISLAASQRNPTLSVPFSNKVRYHTNRSALHEWQLSLRPSS